MGEKKELKISLWTLVIGIIVLLCLGGFCGYLVTNKFNDTESNMVVEKDNNKENNENAKDDTENEDDNDIELVALPAPEYDTSISEEQKKKIVEYVYLLQGGAFDGSSFLPEFDNINIADDGWIGCVLQRKIDPILEDNALDEKTFTDSEISSILKGIFGSNFNFESYKSREILSYSDESDFEWLFYRFESQPWRYINCHITKITKENNQYIVEMVEYIDSMNDEYIESFYGMRIPYSYPKEGSYDRIDYRESALAKNLDKFPITQIVLNIEGNDIYVDSISRYW